MRKRRQSRFQERLANEESGLLAGSCHWYFEWRTESHVSICDWWWLAIFILDSLTDSREADTSSPFMSRLLLNRETGGFLEVSSLAGRWREISPDSAEERDVPDERGADMVVNNGPNLITQKTELSRLENNRMWASDGFLESLSVCLSVPAENERRSKDCILAKYRCEWWSGEEGLKRRIVESVREEQGSG